MVRCDCPVMLKHGVKFSNKVQIPVIPSSVCHQLGRLGCVCLFAASEKLRDLSKARRFFGRSSIPKAAGVMSWLLVHVRRTHSWRICITVNHLLLTECLLGIYTLFSFLMFSKNRSISSHSNKSASRSFTWTDDNSYKGRLRTGDSISKQKHD